MKKIFLVVILTLVILNFAFVETQAEPTKEYNYIYQKNNKKFAYQDVEVKKENDFYYIDITEIALIESKYNEITEHKHNYKMKLYSDFTLCNIEPKNLTKLKLDVFVPLEVSNNILNSSRHKFSGEVNQDLIKGTLTVYNWISYDYVKSEYEKVVRIG